MTISLSKICSKCAVKLCLAFCSRRRTCTRLKYVHNLQNVWNSFSAAAAFEVRWPAKCTKSFLLFRLMTIFHFHHCELNERLDCAGFAPLSEGAPQPISSRTFSAAFRQLIKQVYCARWHESWHKVEMLKWTFVAAKRLDYGSEILLFSPWLHH